MRTAPVGGARGRRREKNRSVVDENLFFETATKNKLWIFGGSIVFCRLGLGISVSAQTPQKPVNRHILKKTGETPQRRQSKEVAQGERRSDEPKHSQKLPGGAELWPKRVFCRLGP